MNSNNEYPDLFDETGHLNEEGQALTVDALILGKMPRLPVPVQEHMTHCPDCRKEIASLYDLVAENKELHPRVYHPLFDRDMEGQTLKKGNASFAKRFLWRLRSPWGIAASLLLLFALGGSWFFLASREGEEEKLRQEIMGIMEPDSGDQLPATLPEETLQYADNHGDMRLAPPEGNPRLEAMYKLRLRGNDFKMVSPGKNTSVRHLEKIVFEWETSATTRKLDLLILDEQGVNRAQIHLKQKRYSLTVNLPQGLYYWVIVGDGALISVGKFSVMED
jgi:hypothetical protein